MRRLYSLAPLIRYGERLAAYGNCSTACLLLAASRGHDHSAILDHRLAGNQRAAHADEHRARLSVPVRTPPSGVVAAVEEAAWKARPLAARKK